MYVGGFLEGLLSGKRIREFRHNANELMQPDEEKHHALVNIRKTFSRKIRNILDHANVKSGEGLSEENRGIPMSKWGGVVGGESR
jgi:hypothetical protein